MRSHRLERSLGTPQDSRPDPGSGRSIRAIWLFGALLLLTLVIGCGHSQIGPSDEALSVVDALYTAVASRRTELLDQSATRIDELHKQGELPAAAHRQLKKYVDQCRRGEWEATVRQLHEFIRGQRRTG
jgi:hypothetical protein